MHRLLRVLMVEDSEEDATLLLRHLRRHGYSPIHVRVASARTMREALQEREWDLVLSDHRMPGFSAMEALAVLQETGLDLPFIIVSGAIGEEEAVAAMRAGANDYIMKDRLGRIERAIERELQDAEHRREWRHAQEAQRFLAQASEILATSLDYEATLAGIANLAVTTMADWCTITLVAENGVLRPLVIAHADPTRVAWATELVRRYPFDPDAPYGTAKVIRTDRPELYTDFSDLLLASAARDAGHLQFFRQLRCTSALAVPLSASGRTLGAITMVAAESGRRYTASDLAVAQALAYRAAMAVENALLFHEAQQAARQKEEALARLDALLTSAPLGIAFIDPELRYIQINGTLAQANGLPVEEHIGRRVREVLPKLAVTLEPMLRRVLTSGEPLLNLEMHSLDQSDPARQRHWLVSLYPVYTPDRKLLGVGAAALDVTLRDRARLAVEESNAKLQALVAASPLPIEALDPDGRVTAWSPAAERFFGWTEAEVVGRAPPGIPADRLEEHWNLLRRALPGEPLMGTLVRRLRRDGSQVELSLSVAPLCAAGGQITGYVCVYLDVTEHNRFLYVASHELRNPLTTIRGISDLIVARTAAGKPPEAVVPLVGMLDQEVARLTALVGEIMEAFLTQQGRLPLKEAPVNLNHVIAESLAPFRAMDGKHRFTTEGLEGGTAWVRGDAARLEQVMSNLVGNALKYSPDGGEVAVRLALRDGRARIAVQDSGVGIPLAQQSRVFEAFFRADNLVGRDPGGLGLGLFICQGVIRRHGGRLWVESEQDRGATFYVELPLSPPDA